MMTSACRPPYIDLRHTRSSRTHCWSTPGPVGTPGPSHLLWLDRPRGTWCDAEEGVAEEVGVGLRWVWSGCVAACCASIGGWWVWACPPPEGWAVVLARGPWDGVQRGVRDESTVVHSTHHSILHYLKIQMTEIKYFQKNFDSVFSNNCWKMELV